MQSDTESPVAHFRDDYYRDGFRKILLSLGMTVAAIGLLVVLSLYFFLHQVLPISFSVNEGFRVQSEVPLDRPYLQVADLIQWVSQAIPSAFDMDFINYETEQKAAAPYFTPAGWNKYLDLTNTYMNATEITNSKIFVQVTPSGAPVVLNQGVVEGKYGWWVQIPLDVRYSGVDGNIRNKKFVVQVLVVRIPTLNNLDGVAIENIIVNQG